MDTVGSLAGSLRLGDRETPQSCPVSAPWGPVTRLPGQVLLPSLLGEGLQVVPSKEEGTGVKVKSVLAAVRSWERP